MPFPTTFWPSLQKLLEGKTWKSKKDLFVSFFSLLMLKQQILNRKYKETRANAQKKLKLLSFQPLTIWKMYWNWWKITFYSKNIKPIDHLTQNIMSTTQSITFQALKNFQWRHKGERRYEIECDIVVWNRMWLINKISCPTQSLILKW